MSCQNLRQILLQEAGRLFLTFMVVILEQEYFARRENALLQISVKFCNWIQNYLMAEDLFFSVIFLTLGISVVDIIQQGYHMWKKITSSSVP